MNRLQFINICLIIIFLGTITISLSAATDSTQNVINYSDQLKKLLSIEKKGIAHPDLYNQIGLAYYNLNQSGKAVLYFLRALRLNSAHSDARNNLNYAINHSLDKELYEQPSFLASLFQKALNKLSLNVLAVLVLIFLISTVVVMIKLFLLSVDEDKKVYILWLTIIGFIFLLFAVTLGFKYKSFIDDKLAVVIEPEVEGFSGPGAEFGKLFTVHAGLKLHINKVDRDWALVTLPNGYAGWISSHTIERVNP